MKNLQPRNMFAIIAFITGISGAFSFKPAQDRDALYIGYIHLAADCLETDVLCSDLGPILCKSGTQNLYGLTSGGTTCALQLFRIP